MTRRLPIHARSMLMLLGCLSPATLLAAPQFTQEADVVVVGAGSAGLSATVALTNGGAKVILLEQNPFPGGASNAAEGVFGVGSRLQRDHYYGAPMMDKDEVFHHEMSYSHWKANAPLMKAFVDQSGETIDWLEDQGVKFEEVMQTTYTGIRTWHVAVGHGAGLIRALMGKAKQNGAQVFMMTQATGLITDDQKHVIGVTARGREGELRIRAKAVVLATGGFIDNPEMVKQYGNSVYAGAVANFGKVGFGIKSAQALGARTEGMGTVMHTAVYDKKRVKMGPPNPVDLEFDALGQQPANLMVNNYGVRFADEIVANDFVLQANAIIRQPTSSCWIVFSEAQRRRYVDKGTDAGMGVIVPIGTKLAKMDANIDKYIAEGDRNIHTADTVEELAARMKVPAAALKKTLETYNRDCDLNLDSGFGKNRFFMQKLSGKLYAMHEVISPLTTVGGVCVNNQMQALDEKDQPIPGLYVTGCDVGGLYGDSYGLDSPGTAFGFACGSGRMAAAHILSQIKK